MADQVKKNYGDEIDDQLNYLANSMKDWEQSEHALSEAAAMLSGISRNDQDGESFRSLKQGLDDITASLNRMSAAAREDMADVIEQTQRDNDLFDAINIGPVLEDTPINSSPLESGSFGVPTSGSQPDAPLMQEAFTNGVAADPAPQPQPATQPQPQPQPQPVQQPVSSPLESEFVAMPEPKEKTISKLKPLDDSTSGMEIEKLAALYKTSSHGKSSSKAPKAPKAPKASKAAKASKASKTVAPEQDVFETVVKEEPKPSGDGFRFVADKQIVENPVEWKMDESLLRAAEASKAQEVSEAEEQIAAADTAENAPEQVSEQTPLTASAGTDATSALLSDETASPAEPESDGMLSFEPSDETEELMSALTPEPQTEPEELMSELTPEPQMETEERMSELTPEPEPQTEPEELMSELTPEPEPQPSDVLEEDETHESSNEPVMSEQKPLEEMTFTNDMFDLGIELSDEPDYSDENINLDVFSGSIEDAEKYAAQDNSIDLDAAEAEQNAINTTKDDLSNLVAAALNDLASRPGDTVEENIQEDEPEVAAFESEAADPEAAAPETDEESGGDVPTISNLEAGEEDDGDVPTISSLEADEEDDSDIPTVSTLEQELKEQEIEKKIKQGEESRQNNEAGFAYALNDVEQAATEETAEEMDEDAAGRVFAQYVVHTDSEGEERSYYRLILR